MIQILGYISQKYCTVKPVGVLLSVIMAPLECIIINKHFSVLFCLQPCGPTGFPLRFSSQSCQLAEPHHLTCVRPTVCPGNQPPCPTWSLSWQGENEKCQQLTRQLAVCYHTESPPMIKTGLFWCVSLSIWPADEVLDHPPKKSVTFSSHLNYFEFNKLFNYSFWRCYFPTWLSKCYFKAFITLPGIQKFWWKIQNPLILIKFSFIRCQEEPHL